MDARFDIWKLNSCNILILNSQQVLWHFHPPLSLLVARKFRGNSPNIREQ